MRARALFAGCVLTLVMFASVPLDVKTMFSGRRPAAMPAISSQAAWMRVRR